MVPGLFWAWEQIPSCLLSPQLDQQRRPRWVGLEEVMPVRGRLLPVGAARVEGGRLRSPTSVNPTPRCPHRQEAPCAFAFSCLSFPSEPQFYHPFPYFGGSDGKEPACNAGDLGSIPGQGRFPRRREWQLTPVFLPEESHEQRSLLG